MVPARTWSPTGNPSTSPAGTVMAGLPLRFEGAVSAALFMIALENPSSWMRSAPGMVAGGGPCAAKATSGFTDAMTKSAASNRSAIASFNCRRYDSIDAALSNVKRSLAASRPKRISGESSSIRSG